MSVQTVDEIALKIKVQDDGSWVVENLQEKIKKSTKNIGKSFNTANKSLASWMKNMAKATGIFAGFYGVVRGGVNIIKGLITDTENFDTELTQVATLVDTTQVNIDQMSDSLFGMAGAMGEVGDLTRGTYMEISASVPAKESLNELTYAAKFAAGGQADLAKAVNLGTTVLNSYGKEVGNTEHVFDVLWQTIKDGKTNAAQLSQYLGDVIDIGRETGLTFEEVGGSLAIMTQISGHTGKSVTALRGIMSAIQKPSSEAAKEAERIGVNFSTAAVKTMGFENWLRHLNDAIQKNNGDTATLFGQVEALNGIYQLTRNNLQNFSEEMKKQSNVAGNNQEAYEKYLQSFQGSWNEIKNKLQALFIQVILPLMKEFAKWLRENSDGVMSFARNFISGIKTIIGFIAQFKDVIILAGKAWAVHFAISKITSWKNAFLGGMGSAGNSLKTFWGELKKSKDYFVELRADGGKTFSSMNQSIDMVASKSKLAAKALGMIQTVLWTIALDKLYELYNLLDEVTKLEAQTALKEVEYGIQDRERWNAQKTYMLSYAEQLRQIRIDHAFTFDENKKRTLEAILNTSELNQKHKDLLNTFEIQEQLEKAMSQAQGDTYQEKLTWLRRHKEAYAGIIDYVEAGLAMWQIEQGMHTKLTSQYEAEIKKMYEIQGVPLPKYFNEVKKEVEKTTGALATGNGTLDETTNKMGEYLDKIGLLSSQKLKELQQETDIYTKIVTDNANELGINQAALLKVKEEIEKIQAAYQNAGQEVPPEVQKLTEMVDSLDYSFGNLGKEVRFSKDVIHSTTPDIDLMKESVAAADEMTMTFEEHLEDLAKDLFQLSSLLLQATDFLSEFGIIGEGTANMLSNIGKGIGSIAGGLESITKEGANFFDYVSGGISLLSGFGAIAKGIFDGIASLFTGDGVGKAIDRERQNIDISESMEEIIRQTEEVIGNTHAAISLHFKEIVQEADITISNIANYWQRARDILADLDRGTLSAQEAAASVGESFNALLAQAQRLGTEGSREMIQLIGDVRNRGLEVAEITEYVNSKLTENVKAISTYISTFKDIGGIRTEIEALNAELAEGNLTNQEATEIQQQLILKQEELSGAIQDVAANWDFVQAGIMSTFHAWEAQGFSFIEICKMMGSDLNWIAQTAKETGLEVSERLQAMTNMAAFINQHEELAQRIQATQTMMQGLADTDFFNETDFNMFLTQTKQHYQEILKYTDDEEMALRLISPILQDIIKYSESYNFVIDEETQGIINLANEHKVLGQEEKSHYEVTNELLYLIAEALGAKIPEGLREMMRATRETVADMTGEFNTLHHSIGNTINDIDRVSRSMTSLSNTSVEWVAPPVSAASGINFIVPPGYEEEQKGYPMMVHSGELVQVFTRYETQRILKREFNPDFLPVSIPGPKIQGNLNDGFAPYFVQGQIQTVNKNDFKFNVTSPIEINLKSESKIDKDILEKLVLELVDDEYRGFGARLAERVERRLEK
jgi:TP901 family phage tail tape measure protein